MRKVMIIGVNDHGFQVYPKASPPSDCMHMRIELRPLMDKPGVLIGALGRW